VELFEVVRAVYNHPSFDIVSLDQEVPQRNSFMLGMEFIFSTTDGVLGIKEAAAGLGERDFYPSIFLPITYADCIATCLKGTAVWVPVESIYPSSVPSPFFRDMYSKFIIENSEHAAFLFDTYVKYNIESVIEDCILYSLWYFYAWLCKNTGCPYNKKTFKKTLMYIRDNHLYMRGRYLIAYMTPTALVSAFFVPAWITPRLIPRKFIFNHPEYFKLVPKSELFISCMDSLGLQPDLSWYEILCL